MTLEQAYVPFFGQFYGPSLEIGPLREHGLVLSQNFIQYIFLVHFVVFDVHLFEWDQIQVLYIIFVVCLRLVSYAGEVLVGVMKDFALADMLNEFFVGFLCFFLGLLKAPSSLLKRAELLRKAKPKQGMRGHRDDWGRQRISSS